MLLFALNSLFTDKALNVTSIDHLGMKPLYHRKFIFFDIYFLLCKKIQTNFLLDISSKQNEYQKRSYMEPGVILFWFKIEILKLNMQVRLFSNKKIRIIAITRPLTLYQCFIPGLYKKEMLLDFCFDIDLSSSCFHIVVYFCYVILFSVFWIVHMSNIFFTKLHQTTLCLFVCLFVFLLVFLFLLMSSGS